MRQIVIGFLLLRKSGSLTISTRGTRCDSGLRTSLYLFRQTFMDGLAGVVFHMKTGDPKAFSLR